MNFKRLILFILFALGITLAPCNSLYSQQSFPQVVQVNENAPGNIKMTTQNAQNGASDGVQTVDGININQQQINKRPNIITQAASLALMSLLPYFVILLTAFIKIVVVLSLLRNALGLQQSPPNQVINGLALILSVYVMFPTGLAMYDAGRDLIDNRAPTELVSSETSGFIIELVQQTKEPLKGFLERNTSAKHIKGFYQLAYKVFPEPSKASLKPNDFLILVPSYITSQLKDAYEIGVLIYLPFFVIDLVVSNILLAMGMMMLSPLTIALPLKLLLLVMLDGWTVLIQGLVLTFR